MARQRFTLCLRQAAAFMLAVAAWTAAAECRAQDKIINNSRMIGVGGANILDTYLSQEKYSGTEVRYISHTVREKEGSPWARMIVHQGRMAFAKDRSGNGSEMGGGYKFSYGVLYGWQFLDGCLGIKAGAMADAYIGFLYNTRNSNNPAQGRFNIDIAPVATAAYRFHAGKLPMTARYEVSAPLCGLMFSPNYGQSYYEIFSEGDYDHNIVPTTFVSTPSLRQTVSIDVTLGKTTLRLGYMGDWRQSKVNSLRYHSYSNMFVIGITRRFKLLKMQP